MIDEKMYNRIIARLKFVEQGVARIERASSIKYPNYYIEPSMLLSISAIDEGFGILFARTLPIIIDNKVEVIIQLTAPLIAFGLKGTIHAILAHEFLHYLEFIAKMIRFEIVSDSIADTLFESRYSDLEHLLDARRVFNDRALIRLLDKKFPDGFSDQRLEDKSIKEWLNKGYPTKRISIEDNITKIPIDAIINTPIDPILEDKINNILSKSRKIRKRR